MTACERGRTKVLSSPLGASTVVTDCLGKEDGSGALAASAPRLAPCIQAMWPWASHLVALGLSFFIYKMETMTLALCNFNSVQSLSCVRFFETSWATVCQASLSITNSWSLLKLMSIESMIPSNHLILCHPLLLPYSIFPGMRIFSNESVLCIR